MQHPHFKMIRGFLFFNLILISYFLFGCESKKSDEETQSQTPIVKKESNVIDPQAMEILHKGLDYLSNLKQFSAQAQSSLEDILDSGHRVDYQLSGSVTVNRPNQLRTERYGNKMHQIFYYNGKSLTLYNPDQKVYATEPAPNTIEGMFFFARDTLGLSEPISDLLYPNSFELLTQNVSSATVIGKEMIGDIQCDHLLFSCPGADFQIWIADTDQPLPMMYLVTDTSTPELLSFTSVIKNWNINPKISDDLFNFVPPTGTNKIIFLKDNSKSWKGQ